MKESKKKKNDLEIPVQKEQGKKKRNRKMKESKKKKMVWRYQSRKNRGKKKGTEK